MGIKTYSLVCNDPIEHRERPWVQQSDKPLTLYCSACLDNLGNQVLAMSGMGHLRVGETIW